MNIKQVVTAPYFHSYCSYDGIEFTDANGNDIKIAMNDDQYLDFQYKINSKCEYILERRQEKLRKQMEELQEDD